MRGEKREDKKNSEWWEDRLWCFFSPSLAELDFVDYKLLYGLSTPPLPPCSTGPSIRSGQDKPTALENTTSAKKRVN